MQPESPNRQTLHRIVLIGFMGAGKSTVGPILADLLGWNFVDADRKLESETGKSIANLFTTLGEPAFRHLEAQNAASLIRSTEIVIALGGGAVETETTRVMLSKYSGTCVVFLQAPLEVMIQRCEQQLDAAIRPVLQQREALRQRFLSRLPHYEAADVTVDTSGLDPRTVAENVLHQLLKLFDATPLNQKATTT